MRIVNLTNHWVKLIAYEPAEIQTSAHETRKQLPPSGKIARLKEAYGENPEGELTLEDGSDTYVHPVLRWVSLYAPLNEHLKEEPFPEPEDGILYIVDKEVAVALHRPDVVYPIQERVDGSFYALGYVE